MVVWLKRTVSLLALLLVVMQPGYSVASEREYAIKAGFIYNFARYSEGEWFQPAHSSEYLICSTDGRFVEIAKRTLKDQMVKDRLVVVKQIELPESGCNSLFVSATQEEPAALVHSPEFRSTMIIGESKGFVQAGGHLNFFIAGGKIRFEVSPSKLKRAHIKMSSKVLRMGRTVVEASQ